MSESAYNSPLPLRRFTNSCCSSPARSLGGHSSAAETLTDSDGEGDFLITETPGLPDQTVITGWLKFRDNKKVCSVIRIIIIKGLFLLIYHDYSNHDYFNQDYIQEIS